MTNNSSIWGHSKSHTDNHIIFSGSDTLTLALKLDAQGISYKKVFGCYKGTKEISFVTNAKHFKKILTFPELGNEESILRLSVYDARDRRKAELVYLKEIGRVEYIGQFRSTTKEIAIKQDAYSHDPSTGIYYIVEPQDAKGRLQTI